MNKQFLFSLFATLALSFAVAQSAHAVRCGDSFIDIPAGEQCDDGNVIDGDGCSSTCQLESVCGDGKLDAGEACDDGNTTDGDGCSSACTIEPVCGDGKLDEGEQCDDGNTTNGDGCSSQCTIEEPRCGDGKLDEGEQCDDGNTTNGDGCSALCEIEKAGGQGCTPGYWKQTQHYDSWTAPYTPTTLFSDVFENAFPGQTLVGVMQNGGGGLDALGRHTVAALLNAASSGVSYGMTPSDVINAFNSVFPGSKDDYTFLKDDFANANESGCPLN
jgi:cysteine-rich repeat protein